MMLVGFSSFILFYFILYFFIDKSVDDRPLMKLHRMLDIKYEDSQETEINESVVTAFDIIHILRTNNSDNINVEQ